MATPYTAGTVAFASATLEVDMSNWKDDAWLNLGTTTAPIDTDNAYRVGDKVTLSNIPATYHNMFSENMGIHITGLVAGGGRRTIENWKCNNVPTQNAPSVELEKI